MKAIEPQTKPVLRDALRFLLLKEEMLMEARREFAEYVCEAYPIGTVVRWLHGTRVRSAIVTGYVGRHTNPYLMVRPNRTGARRTYRIGAWLVYHYERMCAERAG